MLTIEKQSDGTYKAIYNGVNIGQFMKKDGGYVWATSITIYWTVEELYTIADKLAELNDNEDIEENTVNPSTPPPK